MFKAAPVANPPAPVIEAKEDEVPAAKLKVSGVAFGPIVGVIVAEAY